MAAMATGRPEDRGPTRRRSLFKGTNISPAIFRGWTTSGRPPFSDIVKEGPAPMRRGPGSYKYRVNSERRGPAGETSPGFLIFGGEWVRDGLLRFVNCPQARTPHGVSQPDGQ